MIYIQLTDREIRVLLFKKTLLGQFDIDFFEKRHEVPLMDAGRPHNVDILASAIKEATSNLCENQEKEVYLVLPQSSFSFFKTNVPLDIAPSAIASFVMDKARASLDIDIDSSYHNYVVRAQEDHNEVAFYAISQDQASVFGEALSLLGLKLATLIPDTLAIFKLFDKTLRREKLETILFVSYNNNALEGYLYDSFGLVSDKKWTSAIDGSSSIEQVIKKRVDQYQEDGIKLNRLILSGASSESIRQDTFTKEVGVWTNPLKRIIPNFYEEYVKMLVVPASKPFPILSFDVCFGAFLFSQENKEFNIMREGKALGTKHKMSSSGRGSSGGFKFPTIPLFKKPVLIFLAAFIASVGGFFAFNKFGGGDMLGSVKIPFLAQATPTPTPIPPTPTAAPTPTPSFKMEEVKIKVLNGTGKPGLAGNAKSLLIGAGFEEVLTGNADNYDYKTTVIQVKDEFAGVEQTIKEALADSTESPEVEVLDDEDTSDVIVILGTDYK